VRVAVRAFVIRVWTPGDEVEENVQGEGGLRGVLERIGSGVESTFKSEVELLELLRGRNDEHADAGAKVGGRRG
jgi:hypothetical protein